MFTLEKILTTIPPQPVSINKRCYIVNAERLGTNNSGLHPKCTEAQCMARGPALFGWTMLTV